jgi:hypothetical protein
MIIVAAVLWLLIVSGVALFIIIILAALLWQRVRGVGRKFL